MYVTGRWAPIGLMVAACASTLTCRREPPPSPPPPPATVEAAVLTPDNYDDLVPAGKEVDAIHGDYVLRNDRLVAIVAAPVAGRNANASLRDVGGGVIDLTTRDHPNDQLGAFLPGRGLRRCDGSAMTVDAPASRERAALSCSAAATPGRPAVDLSYELRKGEPYLTIITTLINTQEKALVVPLEDLLEAAGPSFERAPAGRVSLAWAYDRWFGQAYGLAADGREAQILPDPTRLVVRWLVEGQQSLTLQPAERFVLTRRLAPAGDTVALRAIEAERQSVNVFPVDLVVADPAGRGVAAADVTLSRSEGLYGAARTSPDGTIELRLPAGSYHLEAASPGRGSRALQVVAGPPGTSGGPPPVLLTLHAGVQVEGSVTGDDGGPIPCKIMFVGVDGTPTPDFGPVNATEAVKNLLYSLNGRFSRVLEPGAYEVTVSHGPEFDVVTRRLEATKAGSVISLPVSLHRSVETPGWVSADFHSHSTVSGDSWASVRGRVLNLAAEQIEFAPSTEHNRIATYASEIAALGLEEFIKSSAGLELTGVPFPINHQNAFPLRMVPRTQDNGGPAPDDDPVAQVRRLAEWDGGSEKLVQQNHPDLGWMYYDRDGDSVPDGGLAGMLQYQDVIEVFSTLLLHMEPILFRKTEGAAGEPPVITQGNNLLLNWLQLLNQGVRLPAVANTDAHETYHGSGGQRNYVKCATDDPSHIDPMDIVRNAEQGHIVMTNGPYLEVTLTPLQRTLEGWSPGPRSAIPGDEIAAPSGVVRLHVRVQTSNWIDIDRVRVLLNGRFSEDLSFTRYRDPEAFGPAPVRFDQEWDFGLKTDTHVLVQTGHLKVELGPIMGPKWGRWPPVAIANPIFVDVDGDGFTANRDTLDAPLPVKVPPTLPAPERRP